jgi:hypothetical protein
MADTTGPSEASRVSATHLPGCDDGILVRLGCHESTVFFGDAAPWRLREAAKRAAARLQLPYEEALQAICSAVAA